MKAFSNTSQDNYNSIFMNNSFEYYYSIILTLADMDIVPTLVEVQLLGETNIKPEPYRDLTCKWVKEKGH